MHDDTITPTPETMLIGIALTQPRALEDIDHLAPDDFDDHQAGEVWATILRLTQQGKPHNVASVSAAGRHDGTILQDLAYMAPVGATAPYYVDLVQKQAVRRRLQQTGTRIIQLTEESELDSMPEVVEIARAEIDHAGKIGGTIEGVNAGDYFAHHLDILEKPTELHPTPWKDLNHLIGGWRPGALYVIGARPGVGKSIIGLQAAVGLQTAGTVLMSTLEMTRDEVENRLIAQTASVPLKAFEDPLQEQHWKRITAHADELSTHKIHIDDRAGIGTTDIRSAARSLARRGKLTGIVVDYLQLMSSPRGDKRPRHEVVADYSRRLKLLAKELHVPVIALSQLNRNSTQGKDEGPKISDLRESGAVEQDADVIMLLHQQEERPDLLAVRVGKNRHGQRGNFELTFEGSYARAKDHQWTPTYGLPAHGVPA